MEEVDLQDYLPIKGDRIAAKSFARKATDKDTRTAAMDATEERKMALLESMRSRMSMPNKRTIPVDDGTPNEETAARGAATSRPTGEKGRRKKGIQTSLPPKCTSTQQAHIASKDDYAILVGFAIYETPNGRYRQVRSPMVGGIRYPRVAKEISKEELMCTIKPLFFPDGKSCHGEIDDFTFDIATDVKGAQLMHDGESVAMVMKRLKTKHFRCYLLAKAVDVNSDSSLADEGIPCIKKPKVRNHKSRNPVTQTAQPGPSTSDALYADSDSSMADNPEGHMDGARYSDTEMQHVQEMAGAEVIVINSGSDIPTSDGLQLIDDEDIGLPLLEYGLPLPDLSPKDLAEEFLMEDIIARSARESGVIDFGPIPQDGPLDDTLPAIVRTITVHRGLVSRDLITFFSKNENVDILDTQTTFEIQMLNEDGSTEVAEDNWGVMRDALCEFWDTFYLQFTVGNTYKIPVLRHDMSEIQWTAVAVVIKIGYRQEAVFPIRLAQPFMQQAIFGRCNNGELVDAFLKFVPEMDRIVLRDALNDYASVDEEDLLDVMDRYNVKRLVTADSVASIVHEVAHKELVQTPMFVADCFHKVLGNILVGEGELHVLYTSLQPTTMKVLKSLVFPEVITK